ncbi:MAG: rRNA maturation RNase YbeY [Oscillospiraceae bacterium]|jgi:probable rRNA maturation factor|nr:rRNA maturation RNase YbeY [Oscillospiraceae bacterium]
MIVDKIRVIISDKQKEIKIPTGIRMLIRRCCNAVLKMEDFKGSAEVNVSLVDNNYIQNLNKQYREKDMPTDVLTFPMGKNGEYDINPENGAKILGDIVISVEKVTEQSKLYGHTVQREMAYLIAHGMLHILGYDHEAGSFEKLRMREREEKVMNLLGLPCTSSYVLN